MAFDYTLSIYLSNGENLSKQSIPLRRLVAVMASSVFASTALAETITLEDISVPDSGPYSYAYVPDGYHGLTWSGEKGAESWIVTPHTEAWLAGALAYSGSNAIWANGIGDHPSYLTISGRTFDFNGLWGRSYIGSSSATFTGYTGADVVFTRSVEFGDSYQYYDFSFVGIDKLVIANMPTTPVFDDISITAVPEPSMYGMFVLGLGAVGFAASRRRMRS